MPQFAASVGAATLANALGRSVNVLLPITVVGIYGATPETDRFFFVLALSFFFFSPLSYVAAEASVPISVRFNRGISSQGVFKIGLATTSVLFLIASFASIAVMTISYGYALGFALMSGAGIANGFATGILHAHSRYVWPALTWALRIIPLSLFVVSGEPVAHLHLLSIGIGMADWLRLGVLLLRRPATCPEHRVYTAYEFIRKHLSDFVPLAAAMTIMGMNPIIDRLIAHLSGPGSLSILDTGERLYGIFATLCTLGMISVLLTRLSHAVSSNVLDKKWPDFIKMAIAWSGLWLTLGVVTGCGLFGEWISDTTSLSEFQWQTVQWTYWCYLPGIVPFTISIVYIKRLQATQRYWMLAIVALFMVALNALASLVLRIAFGVPGIALATTLTNTAHGVVLLTIVNRCRQRRDRSPKKGV